MSNNKQNHIVEVNKMVSSIDKEFVPYEEALALKELGFDKSCFASYFHPNIKKIKYPCTYHYKNSTLSMGKECCTAPTLSQAFRWFRKKYDLFIAIVHYENGYSINDLRRFETYEEAELECLKKLIEIANEQQ